jgi:hypothetical protein
VFVGGGSSAHIEVTKACTHVRANLLHLLPPIGNQSLDANGA